MSEGFENFEDDDDGENEKERQDRHTEVRGEHSERGLRPAAFRLRVRDFSQ